jgi:photosystem II stability/assembly factor-like uncharacterized protein
MKKFSFLILAVALVQGLSFSQTGWFINHADSMYNWQSCCFVNANTGYMVGFKDDQNNFRNERPLVYKTMNAGASWSLQTTAASSDTAYFTSVYFTDANTGFITIASLFMYFGKILKTTNGGTNWNAISFNDSTAYYSIFFPNQSVGFAVGGKIDPPYGYRGIKTTNNGNTWARMNIPVLGNNLVSVSFADVNTGYILGAHGDIFKTTNSGNNWVLLNTNTSNDFANIYFINALTGMALGGSVTTGTVLRTDDGGSTWTLTQYSTCPLIKAWFTSPSVGYIVGWCHQILKTTNGGLNWFNQISPSTSQLFNDVFFTSENTGYIAGQHSIEWFGLILKTTTGGETLGIEPISNEIPEQFNLCQNYPNPFNPSTKIKFDIPRVRTGRDLYVQLVIYDLLGRRVTTLVNEQLQTGTYEVEFDGTDYPSGVYYYKLIAGEYSETKKMVLVK